MAALTAVAMQRDRDDPFSWYVYWEFGVSYGARGTRLTEPQAVALAGRMLEQGRWDAV